MVKIKYRNLYVQPSRQSYHQTDELSWRIDKLVTTSAITAYNQERSRKELKYASNERLRERTRV